VGALHIRFWIDKWVGGVRLCDRFPRLYHLDRRNEGRVAEKGNWVDGAWNWKWDWVRILEEGDRWGWALHESGDFTVKELTKLVEEKILDVNNEGRLPVREELDKRGIDLDTLLCPSCGDVLFNRYVGLGFCGLVPVGLSVRLANLCCFLGVWIRVACIFGCECGIAPVM
ncbi:hypothetical protein Tco_1065437, partial [Tanacetum coccineum]